MQMPQLECHQPHCFTMSAVQTWRLIHHILTQHAIDLLAINAKLWRTVIYYNNWIRLILSSLKLSYSLILVIDSYAINNL